MGVWDLYNGQVKEFRSQGYTLQAIGDKFGVTRERIRQILNEHYGNTRRGLITRESLAKFLKCSATTLGKMEKQGILKPTHRGRLHLYNRDEAEKATLRTVHHLIMPYIEKICEECGRKFYVKPYNIREVSPRRFCSKFCQGKWVGNHYGFTAHPENTRRQGEKRKWDWDEVRKLRLETGWSSIKIGKALGIPKPTVYSILRKTFGLLGTSAKGG